MASRVWLAGARPRGCPRLELHVYLRWRQGTPNGHRRRTHEANPVFASRGAASLVVPSRCRAALDACYGWALRRHLALTRVRQLAQSLSLPEFQRHIGPFGLLRHSLEALEALPGSDGAATTEVDPQEIVGKVMLLALASGDEQVVTLTRPEPGAEISVGRLPGRDLTIDDPSVSKLHAVIRWSEDPRSCLLRDLGSTNGTFVNALRLTRETVTLQDGDVISFGDVAYSYQLAESIYRRLGGRDEAAKPAPPPPTANAAIGAVKLRRVALAPEEGGDDR